MALEWNTHRLRKNCKSSFVGGHPDELFYMSQIYGELAIANHICYNFIIMYRFPRLPL